MHVSELYVYPVKACRGIALGELHFERLGPRFDRRFMLIDPEGNFVTQRTLTVLCLVETRIAYDCLLLAAPSMPELRVPLRGADASRREVRVWRFTGDAQDVGDEAADWFSRFTGLPLRLVRFPEHGERRVSSDYARGEHHVAFSDGYPILLIGQGSLDELNRRLAQPVPMNRFRPNLVISGTAPHAEDGFRRIRVGEAELDVVKPCDRCTVTTVDQLTAQSAKEPLKTLAGYRSQAGKVMFGQNCVYARPGTIRLGDPVEIIE